MAISERIRDRDAITKALLCLIVLVGAALRVYQIGAESYWVDEVTMVQVARGDMASIVAVAAQTGRPPVYVTLAHFWMQLFGTSEAATRSLSALAGTVSLVLMYLVGSQLFSRRVGLISALLMAISSFQIYHSQNFRYYSLFVLMTLCSFLFFRRALTEGRRRHYVGYLVASILLFYTHTFAIFILAAQNLYFLLRWNSVRKARTGWLISQAILLVAIAPGLFVALRKVVTGTSGPMAWISDPSFAEPLITLWRYFLPRPERMSLVALGAAVAFFAISLLLFVVLRGKEHWLASVRGLGAARRELATTSDQLLLVTCWLLCPIVLPFVLSKMIGPMYVSRYTISAAPAFYLLLALAILTVRKVVPEVISLGLLIILVAPGLHARYTTSGREQWREVAAYVEQNAHANEKLVLIDSRGNEQFRAFSWYYRGNLHACRIESRLRQQEEIAQALKRCVSAGERFWLIVRHDPDSLAVLRAYFLNQAGVTVREIRGQRFVGITLFLYEVVSK